MSEILSLSDYVSRLSASRVLCIGDLMLDRFFYGQVDRISPEAPIPVIRVTRENRMLGGVGNVVANLRTLGVHVALVGAVGADSAATEIKTLLGAVDVAQDGLVTTPGRPTILKDRYISARQQLLRADWEETGAFSADIDMRVRETAIQMMDGCGAVILSDYGKGILSPDVIAAIIAAARSRGIPVIVDPKGADYTRYAGATYVTPNRKELEQASRMTADADDDVRAAALSLITRHNIGGVLATRSEKGLSLISADAAPFHIPTEAREVFDVTGAGDTVVAVFAAAIAVGITPEAAARMANAAAGIAVGKVGTATVRPDELSRALDAQPAAQVSTRAAMTLADAVDQRRRWQAEGLRVGMTNGCFDLLHSGHLSLIREAKAQCDRLIVAVNTDAAVRALKGPNRPVHDEDTRTTILSALRDVDAVVLFDDPSVFSTIKALMPDVLVKGGDYTVDQVVGADIVMAAGGRVHLAGLVEGKSTTNTVKKIAAG